MPRHAQYLHNAWKRHQDAVYWVDIDLAIQKGLTFYQTRSNAIILQETHPVYCIPKIVGLKTGEVLYEKKACHLDLHQRSHYVTNGQENWVRKLFNNQKEKLFDNQKEKWFDKPSFSNQPNEFQIIRDRSGRPDDIQDGRNTSRSQEINVNSFNEELSSSDRTGRLVVSEDMMSLNVEQTHDITVRPVATLNTADAKDSSSTFCS